MTPAIKKGLDLYASEGIPTGSFLRAVLENNLMLAVVRADPESLRQIREICLYVHNELEPGLCHGSRERVAAWLEMKAAKRLEAV
jgi:hypothetical protein